jgi:nucleoside-diphosphate-sugar epimerase
MASFADEIYHLSHNKGPDDDSRSGREAINMGNVLEAARRSGRNPTVICASIGNELMPANDNAAPREGSGGTLLNCSSTDRLVQDFARLHNLPAVALRIDTVTGPRQFGEGQDWVARLEYEILGGHPRSIPSHLSRTHNVLHVSDAIQAVLAARAYIGKTAGKAYSLNGGCAHSITIEQMIQLIQRVCHRTADIVSRKAADGCSQPCSEDRSFLIDTPWRARKSLEEIVRDIAAFWNANRQIIASHPRIQRDPARLSRVQAA